MWVKAADTCNSEGIGTVTIFDILGLTDKIRCIQADAAEFDQYGNYNIFFLFNPFSEEIVKKVADQIIKSRDDEKYTATIIYHNPVYLSAFESNARVIKKEILHDSLKNYDTCIMRVLAFRKRLKNI